MLKMSLSPFGLLGMATFCQKDLSLPIKELPSKAEITIRQANESDIEQLSKHVATRYGPSKELEWYKEKGIRETILQRFRRGCKCFVAKIGPEIVHYNWIFPHGEESVSGTGRFISMRDDEALCEDAFTSEAWRGKGIHLAVNNQMLLFLQSSGYRRAYTVVGTHNKSAQKALHRIGWEFLGTMLYFIPRGREKAWIWQIHGTLDPFVNGPPHSKESRPKKNP
jgi:RimJ/RimL family protein N-acetyltransferase